MDSSSPPSGEQVSSCPDANTQVASSPSQDSFTGKEGPQRARNLDDNAEQSSHKPSFHRTGTAVSPFPTRLSSSFDNSGSSNTDRVFPIRSVVSLDPSPTPTNRLEGAVGDEFPGLDRNEEGDKSSAVGRQSSMSSTTSRRSRPATPYNEALSNTQSQLDEAVTPSTVASEPQRRSGMFHRRSPEPRERMGGSRQMQTFADTASVRSQSISSTQGPPASASESVRSMADEPGSLITARFKHAVTEGGHAVITGRDGNTLQRCEDEPIHVPGAIQSFGLLIALSEEEEGKFKVRVVSENSERIIGFTPKQLFALQSFCDILSDEQTDNLLDHIDFIRDEEADPATNGPEVFTIAIRAPKRRTQKLWCAMHINGNSPDIIICEFELEDDTLNPLVPAGEATPEPPEDTLQTDPTPEEYAESTVNMSKPLRVLRSARKRKGEAAAMEVFNIMSQVQEQLANASTLDAFLKILVGVVKELTGFHRVMIYQFDQSWNGRVVTELVDPRATKDLYKGLNFPASDIPKQARDLYKINKVRLLYDRDQETARLVCRTVADLETPLDLTFAYLRAMSPIHIKYLGNMAVRASMSISINAFDELWGLIACHSYGSKGMRVSFPIRKMCRLIGDSASRNIERLSYASRLQARKLINTAPTASNPSGYIIASSDDLLKLFDADYGLLSIRNETKILGKLEQTQEALALLEYLRLRKFTTVIHSTDVRIDFPDLRYRPGFNVIAGLLLVPLSVGGQDFIVFFRKGQVREVKWAGNPYEKFVKEGTEGYLEPRKSFKTWSETVVGKCREWTEEQAETAAVLCLVYGKFIEVWRQKEVALENSELTRLLLANSAHEVRTPLNAIINYLEIALEGAIDQETRDNLAKSHSASKSLVYVINDLLDLTKTEEGHNLVKDEIFDLPATIREATDQFRGDAKRKGIKYEILEHDGIPQLVVGDQRRVRQAVSNVTANAIQHTSSGLVKVEVWRVEGSGESVDIDISVEDTGTGMSAEKLDALFRELEQVQTETDEGLQEKLAPQTKSIEAGNESRRTLGLGLALVARIIRNMNGQLRLKSEEGKGSRFIIQLGFPLPSDGGHQAMLPGPEIAATFPSSDQPTTPPVDAGEVLLVDKSAQKSCSASRVVLAHRNSTESVPSLKSVKSAGSLKSFKSGTSARSDVDRLIEAIQEPPKSSKSHMETDSFQSQPATRFSRPLSSSSSRSTSALQYYQSLPPTPMGQKMSGQSNVKDSKTPIKPVRMPAEESCGSPTSELAPRAPSRLLFDVPDKPTKKVEPVNSECLHVLVAEDDPINSRIIRKRLEKLGHVVHLTVNGEECSTAFGETPEGFDVILMDMQMPIVDGLTSTKLIRSFEKTHPGQLSHRASLNSRIPIIAVSASLIEKDRQIYIDGGFDGWILKPVDFQRLSHLLHAIVEEETRTSCLYRPGNWERGGWFRKRQADVFGSSTAPSTASPVSQSSLQFGSSIQSKDNSTDKERERLNSLATDAVHSASMPEDPGHSGDLNQSTQYASGISAATDSISSHSDHSSPPQIPPCISIDMAVLAWRIEFYVWHENLVQRGRRATHGALLWLVDTDRDPGLSRVQIAAIRVKKASRVADSNGRVPPGLGLGGDQGLGAGHGSHVFDRDQLRLHSVSLVESEFANHPVCARCWELQDISRLPPPPLTARALCCTVLGFCVLPAFQHSVLSVFGIDEAACRLNRRPFPDHIDPIGPTLCISLSPNFTPLIQAPFSMGNSNGKPVVFTDQVNLNHFRLLRVVGKGAFGKVRIVERKDTGLTFALKYIRKDEVVRSESVRNIIRERRMLEHLDHPFLCNLRYSFQDIEYLYLVVDLMNGGDLRFHISRKTFTEDAVRFWMAELACALRYIHGQGIVHRDLKPDNVLLDSDGHVHLADFNVASEFRPDKQLHSKSGTLAYLAPEVYAGTGYLCEVDWWSLGVCFYECIYNKRPFSSHGHEKLEKEILKGTPNYPVTQPPVSMPCLHAISSLLEKNKRKRIGASGWETFTQNPFFQVINFELLEKKRILPVFVPSSEKTNFDATYDLEELLLEEAPLEARARRQKPRVQLKDDATDKEIRTDELHRMIETLFEPFDYTTMANPAVSAAAALEAAPELVNPPSQTKGSIDEQPDSESPTSRSGTPPVGVHSNHSDYYPAVEQPTSTSPPSQIPPTSHPQQPSVPSPLGQRQRGGTRNVSKGGGVQVVLGETGSWAELSHKGSSLPADAAKCAEAAKNGKPHGMLGFLSRKTGREKSPKPQESGVLGKEGARVVISSGR